MAYSSLVNGRKSCLVVFAIQHLNMAIGLVERRNGRGEQQR